LKDLQAAEVSADPLALHFSSTIPKHRLSDCIRFGVELAVWFSAAGSANEAGWI
jgi:hypothetical protein